jgi:hypothetical protein
VSSILVFWGGTGRKPAEIATAPDKGFLQDIGDGKIGYSRRISEVDSTYIVERYRRYGGPKPPPIDRHGINDAFIEKGSVVHYYYEGQWLKLTGAD